MTLRSSRSWRTAVAAGAAAGLLLGAAGCSSGGGGSSASSGAAAVSSLASAASSLASSLASASASVSASASASASGSPSGSPSASASAGKMVVTIKNFAFHPATFTVSPGTTITVTNQDDTGHTLTATTPGRQFDTGLLSAGESTTITAPSGPGPYAYHCDVHPNMTGTLVVA
ncbi:cupredoxin domain-containing protein [Kitasatospora sp. NPDC058170]|uniref:cupredoxin domain-containing protein n=1 Tax=Kitasatospora sp. NPDC058170 TaxID=3346364 RepID=UPI0036DD6C42